MEERCLRENRAFSAFVSPATSETGVKATFSEVLYDYEQCATLYVRRTVIFASGKSIRRSRPSRFAGRTVYDASQRLISLLMGTEVIS